MVERMKDMMMGREKYELGKVYWVCGEMDGIFDEVEGKVEGVLESVEEVVEDEGVSEGEVMKVCDIIDSVEKVRE